MPPECAALVRLLNNIVSYGEDGELAIYTPIEFEQHRGFKITSDPRI